MSGYWYAQQKIDKATSFHRHFAADHLIRGYAPNQHLTGKYRITPRTGTRQLRKIFADPLFEAFYQCAFATLAVAIQLGFAAGAKDINGFGRSFRIGFGHTRGRLRSLEQQILIDRVKSRCLVDQ